MTKNAITTIPFHGASLCVIAGDTPETTLVAMKPVVDGMSLEWEPQRKRIARHPVLQTCTSIMEVQMPGDDQIRGHTFMPLNRFHFWLATINPNRIADEGTKDRVIVFQTDAADVLFDHFFGRALGHSNDDTGERHFGISKMTIHKVTGIERLLSEFEHRLDNLIVGVNARVAALEYVSVRELLEEAKAVQKGRRGLNRKVGHDLKVRALLAGHPSPCRRCPHSGVWLFQRDFAGSYMREIGKSLVHAHNAKQTGQTSLRLIGGKTA